MALDGVARVHLRVFAMCLDERAPSEAEALSFDAWLSLTPLSDTERVALRDWLRAVLDGNHACWLVEAPIAALLHAWRAVSYASGDTAAMEAALAWRITTGALCDADAEAAMNVADDAGHLAQRVQALRAAAVGFHREARMQCSYASIALLASCWPCAVPTRVSATLSMREALHAAAAIGDIGMIAWAREQLRPEMLGPSTCAVAASSGHLAVLQWLRAHDFPWDHSTVVDAAVGGHLLVLQWAYEHGCEWNVQVSHAAARAGRVHILEWIHAHEMPWDEDTAADAAAAGHLSVLQWLRAHGCPWNEGTTFEAAANGHLHVLQWAHDNGCAISGADTCYEAARGGHLRELQWLHKHGCEWDSETCMIAAERGHLQALQYARTNGCPWDARVCSSAAQNGHFEVLRWAHENGCRWDTRTCHAAAFRGDMVMLQWARSHGFPWDSGTTREALRGGHLGVLQWALENGCPASKFVRSQAQQQGLI